MTHYRALPAPDSTSKERLQALKDVKPIIAPGGIVGAFAGGSPGVTELLRLAEYVTLGHDYKDTHTTDVNGTLIMPEFAKPYVADEDVSRETDEKKDGDKK